MLKQKFQTLAKKIFPTYRKSCEAVEQSEELLAQLEKQQIQITELKQIVENEANWKRADIVNDLKPILAELKQTIENEANWKRADIVNDLRHVIEWHSDRAFDGICLSQSYDELRFWQLYKMPGEDDLSVKKRFFMTMPKATVGLRLHQRGNAKLLKAFKKICEEHGFTYWLQSGTMLGAIRHKGFVPWDDDTDVGMFRNDIEKLRELLKDNDKYKITLIYDWWAKSRQIRFRSTDDRIPCFLDVYIYDYCEDASDEYWKRQLEKREQIIKAIEEDNSEEVKFWKGNPYVSEYARQAEYLEKMFKRLTDCDNRKIAPEHSKGICWGLDNFSVRWKRLFDNDFFFPLVDLEYENEKYPAPKENLAYVRRQYGDIYKLPKDMLSHIHHVSHEELEKKENMEVLEKFINER